MCQRWRRAKTERGCATALQRILQEDHLSVIQLLHLETIQPIGPCAVEQALDEYFVENACRFWRLGIVGLNILRGAIQFGFILCAHHHASGSHSTDFEG